jgi:trans-aconitate methyltransferase
MSGASSSAASGLRGKLIGQFHRPHGIVGRLAGFILAHRRSNVERNAWTVDLLDIQTTDRVLEIGFGPGVSIAAASALAFEGLVAGIDHSETMLRMASRRNAAAIRAGRVQLVETSLEQLPSFDQPFNKVFGVNVLQFARDPIAVLRGLRESMSSGGLIAITQQSRKRNATDQDSIRAAERVGDLLEQSGFAGTRIETLPLEPVCAACILATAV